MLTVKKSKAKTVIENLKAKILKLFLDSLLVTYCSFECSKLVCFFFFLFKKNFFLGLKINRSCPNSAIFCKSIVPPKFLKIKKFTSVSSLPGLDKLLEAGESVALLSKELVVKEKDLAIASVKADQVSNFVCCCVNVTFLLHYVCMFHYRLQSA